MQRFRAIEEVVRAAPDRQVSLTDPDSRQAYAKQHEDLYAESAYKAARDIDAEFVNNDQNNRRAQEDLKRDETAMNTLHRGE